MPARKSKAAWLALFAGWYGAHRFYLHRRTSGKWYAAFCWTGVPAVISLVEAIRLWFMSEEDFREHYPEAVEVYYSPDRRYWWNGRTWVPAYSADRRWRWDGEGWVRSTTLDSTRPVPEGTTAEPTSAPGSLIAGPAPAGVPALLAASPRLHLHKGWGAAASIAAAFVGALLLGALFDSVLDFKGGYGPVTLLELGVAAIAIGWTYFYVWIFQRYTHDAKKRHSHLVVAALTSVIVFTLSLTFIPSRYVLSSPAGLLFVVPATTVGLLVWRRLDRNEKEPWRLVMITVAWGGIVAISFAVVLEDLLGVFVGQHSAIGGAAGAGIFEELGKGTAVLLLALLFRDEFDGPLDGIVYGAAVGLGLNLVESLGYTAKDGVSQLLLRQTLGLVLGHPLWSALIGAGIGLARERSSLVLRIALIGGGFVAAMFGHFVWDAMVLTKSNVGPAFATEAILAFVLIAVVVSTRWVERRNLRAQMHAEASLGLDAIVPEEVDVLQSPRRRARQRRRALMHGGFRAFRQLGRLRQAQIELAFERWHRARHLIDEPLDAEQLLRDRCIALKEQMGLTAAVTPGVVEPAPAR